MQSDLNLLLQYCKFSSFSINLFRTRGQRIRYSGGMFGKMFRLRLQFTIAFTIYIHECTQHPYQTFSNKSEKLTTNGLLLYRLFIVLMIFYIECCQILVYGSKLEPSEKPALIIFFENIY